jgi:hypothetical protein
LPQAPSAATAMQRSASGSTPARVGGRVDEERKPDPDDERPPICPACGVTMGIRVDGDGAVRYACLECGFSDETTLLSVADGRPKNIES